PPRPAPCISSPSVVFSHYPRSFPTRRSSDLCTKRWRPTRPCRGKRCHAIVEGISRSIIYVSSMRKKTPLNTRHELFEVERGFLRSEEHTSELQSRFDLVCRLLLEKKKTRP